MLFDDDDTHTCEFIGFGGLNIHSSYGIYTYIYVFFFVRALHRYFGPRPTLPRFFSRFLRVRTTLHDRTAENAHVRATFHVPRPDAVAARPDVIAGPDGCKRARPDGIPDWTPFWSKF